MDIKQLFGEIMFAFTFGMFFMYTLYTYLFIGG